MPAHRAPRPVRAGGEERRTPAHAAPARRRWTVAWLTLATVVLVAVGVTVSAWVAVPGAGSGGVVPDGGPPLVGAYYYQWFPQNLAEGTLRAHLDPPQGPDPSTDRSADPRTAQRAIQLADRAGVDFFALDWWPLEPWAGKPEADRARIDAATTDFVEAPNIARIKFCIFYETFALGFDASNETTEVTPAVEAQFDGDMLHLAQRYFADPSYLHLHGRPVVVLYLTRTLTGDVPGLIGGARQVLAAHGYDPYLIGDEVFWRVTQMTPPPTGTTLTTVPQTARIRLFDAVTSYTLEFGGNPPSLGPAGDFTGYPGRTLIVGDELALLRRYRQASDGDVPVIPDVSPGFNDRGVRLAVDHPVQPRRWLPGDGPASTLDHLFRQVALPALDPRAPIVFVTAWNEWNEDTGVEPVPGVPTARDDSPSGTAYTQGYTYGDEGDSALETLGGDIEQARVARLWQVYRAGHRRQ